MTERSLDLSLKEINDHVSILPMRLLEIDDGGLSLLGLGYFHLFRLHEKVKLALCFQNYLGHSLSPSLHFSWDVRNCIWKQVKDSCQESFFSFQNIFLMGDLVPLYYRILASWWLGTYCQATLIIPVCQRWEHSLQEWLLEILWTGLLLIQT